MVPREDAVRILGLSVWISLSSHKRSVEVRVPDSCPRSKRRGYLHSDTEVFLCSRGATHQRTFGLFAFHQSPSPLHILARHYGMHALQASGTHFHSALFMYTFYLEVQDLLPKGFVVRKERTSRCLVLATLLDRPHSQQPPGE